MGNQHPGLDFAPFEMGDVRLRHAYLLALRSADSGARALRRLPVRSAVFAFDSADADHVVGAPGFATLALSDLMLCIFCPDRNGLGVFETDGCHPGSPVRCCGPCMRCNRGRTLTSK